MNNTLPPITVFIAGAWMVTGCGLQPSTVDQRWKEYSFDRTTPSTEDVRVSISSSPSEPGSRFRPKDFSDQAGAAYLEQLGYLSKDADEFAARANRPLGSADTRIDTSSIGRTLIVTVSKPRYKPGHRLIRTRIELCPLNFDFADLSIAATATSTVDIATLSVGSRSTYAVKLAPTLAGSLVGAGEASAGRETTKASTGDISQQIEQLTVSEEDGMLVIYRESERGLDLTGNTLLKLSMRYRDMDAGGRVPACATKQPGAATPRANGSVQRPFVVTDVQFRNGAGLLDPAAASFSGTRAVYAQPTEDYEVRAAVEFVSREIVSGQATYAEGDDVVVLREGKTAPAPFKVLRKADVAKPRWYLRPTGSYRTTTPLAARIGAGVRPDTLTFADLDIAKQFVNYLAAKNPASIGNQEIGTISEEDSSKLVPLTPGQATSLKPFRDDAAEENQ